MSKKRSNDLTTHDPRPTTKDVAAVLVCAGAGRRLPGPVPKAFRRLGRRPLFLHAFETLESVSRIAQIVVVVPQRNLALARRLLEAKPRRVPWGVVAGGPTRTASVGLGLSHADSKARYVLVHDGARPLVSRDVILRVLKAASRHGAAVPGVRPKATMKEQTSRGFVLWTLRRDHLVEIQTPQVFRREHLARAYRKLPTNSAVATDDSSLVERLGVRVKVVPGSYRNLKITTPEDWAIAEALISKEQRANGKGRRGVAHEDR